MPFNLLATKVLTQQEQDKVERILKQLQLELTDKPVNNFQAQATELVELIELLIKKD